MVQIIRAPPPPKKKNKTFFVITSLYIYWGYRTKFYDIYINAVFSSPENGFRHPRMKLLLMKVMILRSVLQILLLQRFIVLPDSLTVHAAC